MPGFLGLHPWFGWTHGPARATIEVTPGPQTMVQGREPGVTAQRPWDACFEHLPEPPLARWHVPGEHAGRWLEVRSPVSTWTVYEQDRDAFCLEPQNHPIGALAQGTAAVIEPGSALTLVAAFASGRWPR
ncbi:MAG: hypothetical protein KGP12_06070 [Actinomycetales bacterium]|nr:hypothetical protein [Actinomycetales bacterium]